MLSVFLMWQLGMRGIPVLEKYRYILYFKYMFHTLQLRNAPVGGSASQIAAQLVNVTTEQCDGSSKLNSINAPEINK